MIEMKLIRCTQCYAPLVVTGDSYSTCVYCGSTIEIIRHEAYIEQEVVAIPWSTHGDLHNCYGELLIPFAESPAALPGYSMIVFDRNPRQSVYTGHFVEADVDDFPAMYVKHATRSDRILGVAVATDNLHRRVDVVTLGRVSGFTGLTPGRVYAKGVIAVSETVMHVGA